MDYNNNLKPVEPIKEDIDENKVMKYLENIIKKDDMDLQLSGKNSLDKDDRKALIEALGYLSRQALLRPKNVGK